MEQQAGFDENMQLDGQWMNGGDGKYFRQFRRFFL